MQNEKNIIYVDTGGTFTDAVIVQPNGIFVVGKASTDEEALENSFLNAIEDAAEKLGKSLQEVLTHTAQVGYGTTVGTNMIVSEAPGPKLGLLTTRGVEDRLHIGRLRSAGLPKNIAMHMIAAGYPKPLVPKPLIKGIRERIELNTSSTDLTWDKCTTLIESSGYVTIDDTEVYLDCPF